MDAQDARLKEYEALRNEFVALLARGDANLGMVWAGVAVLVAAAAYASLPELCFVAFALTVQGWMEDLRRNDAFHRIGAYVEAVLEPKVPGLQWQTAIRRARETDPDRIVSIQKGVLAALAGRYSIVTLGTLASWLILWLAFCPVELHRLVLNVCLVCVAVGVLAFLLFRSERSYLRRQYWLDVFSRCAEVDTH